MSTTRQKMEYRFEKAMTVREIFAILQMKEHYFAVLINGKVADLDTKVEAGQTIFVLPKIAGG